MFHGEQEQNHGISSQVFFSLLSVFFPKLKKLLFFGFASSANCIPCVPLPTIGAGAAEGGGPELRKKSARSPVSCWWKAPSLDPPFAFDPAPRASSFVPEGRRLFDGIVDVERVEEA